MAERQAVGAHRLAAPVLVRPQWTTVHRRPPDHLRGNPLAHANRSALEGSARLIRPVEHGLSALQAVGDERCVRPGDCLARAGPRLHHATPQLCQQALWVDLQRAMRSSAAVVTRFTGYSADLISYSFPLVTGLSTPSSRTGATRISPRRSGWRLRLGR